MSGTRQTPGPLAQLQARRVPEFQQPGRAPGGGFLYPSFGQAPAVIRPSAAPRVTAQPVRVPSTGAAQPGLTGGGGAAGPTGDAADQGAGFTGEGVRSGWGTQDRDPSAPAALGPDPGRMNSIADVAQTARTIGNFATAALTGPLGAIRAAAASPVGYGLAKSISALTGISAATPAPSDLSSLSKPAPEDFADRALSGVLNTVTGFNSQRGGPKGEAPKGAPATTGVEKTAAAPTAATPAPPTPAQAPPEADPEAVGDAATSKDFGGAPAESFNAENTTPGGEAKSDTAAESADGGKGDAAGTGENSESSPGSTDGGSKGGEFRMGGPVQRDTDGHLAAVPILAHENEFVLSPEATAMIGPDLLQRINDMALEAAGHPPRPMDPRFMGAASPLSSVRAGQPPTFVSVRAQAPRPGAGSGFSENAVPGAAHTLAPPPAYRASAAGGFSENAVPVSAQPPFPTPPMPPAAPPRGTPRAAPPRGGGLSADDLNAMSLSIAQGTGGPPQGQQERLAYERIRSVMRPGEEPQQFRMGGMVQPRMPMPGGDLPPDAVMPGEDSWGGALPHTLHGHLSAPMPTFGYEGENAGPQGMEFGYEDLVARFGPDAQMPAFREGGLVQAPEAGVDGDASMPNSFMPRSAQPYAEEGQGDMPFGDDQGTKAGMGTADVAQRLTTLPPEMQQAVAMAIGSDPMVASALLHVLGPHFAPILQAAMKVAAPPAMDPLAQMAGGGGPPMMGPMG